MDANLIYEKTAAGEDAVRQRTKLVQRNTRMVLILVDGNATVGDLCAKTGNAQMVEGALSDLERDGLIAPKLSGDSVWDQSRKVAEEIKAAAVNRLAKEEGRQPEVATFDPVSPPSLEPFSMAPHSIFAPDPAGGVPKANLTAPDRSPVRQQAQSVPKVAIDKPSFAERLAGIMPKRAEPEDDGIAPIRRGAKGPYISWPLGIALAAIGLAVLLAGVFLFYPYGSHRGAIESAISRYVGQPVTVGDVGARFSPLPSIVVERVATRSGDMQASSVQLVPEFFSLLGSRPSFSNVRLEGVRLTDRALASLPAALAAAGSDPGASIARVQFSRLEIGVLGLSLSDLQGEVRLAANAPLSAIEITSSDRSARITFKPQTSGLSAEFEAYAWKPYAESKYQFDSIQGQLQWDGRSLSVRSLDARIFDGSVQGILLFDLATSPTLAGDLTVKHMNVRRLLDGLGHGNQYEGELAGDLKFSGSATTWSDVLARSDGEGSFTVQRGVLAGFDLVEAVRRAGRSPLRGGATRYDQATGRIRVSPDSVRLEELAISAGILRAAGAIDVARGGRMAGRLDVEMRGSASAVRMPVALSGSLKEPVLLGGR